MNKCRGINPGRIFWKANFENKNLTRQRSSAVFEVRKRPSAHAKWSHFCLLLHKRVDLSTFWKFSECKLQRMRRFAEIRDKGISCHTLPLFVTHVLHSRRKSVLSFVCFYVHSLKGRQISGQWETARFHGKSVRDTVRLPRAFSKFHRPNLGQITDSHSFPISKYGEHNVTIALKNLNTS